MNDHVSDPSLSRRSLLASGTGLVGGAVLWASGLTPSAHAAVTEPGVWNSGRSANGWPVLGGTMRARSVPTHTIEGSDASVALLSGDAAVVLLHAARRFHYEVEELDPDDVVGHTTSRKVAASYESNYLSGTALAIQPDQFPVGAGDGLFPAQVATVREILNDCEGVLRWGGDERMPKQGHFQIEVGPGDGRLRKVADKLRRWNEAPCRGAGTD
ncbi:hypothetical protein SAMN04487904_104343 [Actinopolyspora lacussalsi subsp. righensis]|uniref:D-alanyl-D-alanine carboxypeptidase n=1 Tax=Actinopolyspora righensis TaxID=995060 RepID=A0A1I6ZGS2_9ACTN|nr:hypothetical protein SAMN04487904_104343 [Actinopolyspora righensis]